MIPTSSATVLNFNCT